MNVVLANQRAVQIIFKNLNSYLFSHVIKWKCKFISWWENWCILSICAADSIACYFIFLQEKSIYSIFAINLKNIEFDFDKMTFFVDLEKFKKTIIFSQKFFFCKKSHFRQICVPDGDSIVCRGRLENVPTCGDDTKVVLVIPYNLYGIKGCL